VKPAGSVASEVHAAVEVGYSGEDQGVEARAVGVDARAMVVEREAPASAVGKDQSARSRRSDNPHDLRRRSLVRRVWCRSGRTRTVPFDRRKWAQATSCNPRSSFCPNQGGSQPFTREYRINGGYI
jgi:hypothetical protein